LFPLEETIGEGPHTSEKINSKGRLKIEVDAEKGSWYALACWQETQEAVDLLEKVGRENLEITCLISGNPFANKRVWRWRGIGKRQQLINSVLKWTPMKDWPGSTVLDDKKGKVELKIFIVIMSKLTDGQKILQIEGACNNYLWRKERRGEDKVAEPNLFCKRRKGREQERWADD
jgi:hypothetical protein